MGGDGARLGSDLPLDWIDAAAMSPVVLVEFAAPVEIVDRAPQFLRDEKADASWFGEPFCAVASTAQPSSILPAVVAMVMDWRAPGDKSDTA